MRGSGGGGEGGGGGAQPRRCGARLAAPGLPCEPWLDVAVDGAEPQGEQRLDDLRLLWEGIVDAEAGDVERSLGAPDQRRSELAAVGPRRRQAFASLAVDLDRDGFGEAPHDAEPQLAELGYGMPVLDCRAERGAVRVPDGDRALEALP